MVVLLQGDDASSRPLTLTYSGSGSSGATAASPVSSTRLTDHVRVSTTARWPAGGWGRAPSATSSSRSFSIATATYRPLGATATESG